MAAASLQRKKEASDWEQRWEQIENKLPENSDVLELSGDTIATAELKQ